MRKGEPTDTLLTYESSFGYTQIVICDPEVEEPFNEWQPQHIRQGFSWRPRSVSFGVFDTDVYTIEICRGEEIVVDPNAERAIVVPFNVPESGQIGIATVGDLRQVPVGTGTYALLFEHWHTDDRSSWIRFTFVPKQSVEAAILKADPYLSPPLPLLMDKGVV